MSREKLTLKTVNDETLHGYSWKIEKPKANVVIVLVFHAYSILKIYLQLSAHFCLVHKLYSSILSHFSSSKHQPEMNLLNQLRQI